MRLIVATAATLVLATAARAEPIETCTAAWQNMTSADRGDMTRQDWMAKCRKPTYQLNAYIPAYAIAVCKDGHFSRHKVTKHRCSHHGGVDKML